MLSEDTVFRKIGAEARVNMLRISYFFLFEFNIGYGNEAITMDDEID